MTALLDITSTGRICGELQIPMTQLHRIIAELELEPSCRINRVAHYSAADVERIAAHLRGTQAHA